MSMARDITERNIGEGRTLATIFFAAGKALHWF